MKKVLFILPLLFVLLGCSSGEKQNEIDEKQQVTLDLSILKANSYNKEYTVKINANCNWSINSENPDWITLSKNNGFSNSNLIITVSKNETYSDRKTILTVASEDGSSKANLEVVQESNKGIVADDDKNIMLEGNGGEFSIKIKTNIENLSIDTPFWITLIDNKTRTLEDRTLNFKASINDSKSSRSGVISIKGEGEGLEYTVSQEPIKILPSNISFVEGDNLLLSDNSNYELVPVFYPENCTEKELIWTSSDENVISVSNGILKVHNNGEVIISAKNVESDVTASVNVTVKIKAIRIIPISEGGDYMYTANWGFGYKGKIGIKAEPDNSYLGDLIYHSSNPDIVSFDNNTFVANSSQSGTSRIQITDSYSGEYAYVDIAVKRAFLAAGSKNINQTTGKLLISYKGRIYTNTSDKFEVMSVTLVDESDRLIAIASEIESPSNNVYFYTDHVDMTSLFGITVIKPGQLPNLRFLVHYKYLSQEYEEYVDVDILNQKI